MNRQLFAELLCDHAKARKYIDNCEDSYECGMDLYNTMSIYPQKYMMGYNLTTEQYLNFYKLIEEYGCPVDSLRIHYMTPANLEKELREGELNLAHELDGYLGLGSSDRFLSEPNPSEEMQKRIILHSYGHNFVLWRVNRFECFQTVSNDWYNSPLMKCIPGKCTHPPGLRFN